MRQCKLLLIISFLWVASTAYAEDVRPARAALTGANQDLLDTWLSLDCQVGTPAIQAILLRVGVELERALWEAVDLGPSQAELEELATISSERFSARQRWLRSHAAGVDQAALAALLKQTQQQFVDDELGRLRERQKAAALVALALVGSPKTQERLAAIASDPLDPSSSAARGALTATKR